MKELDTPILIIGGIILVVVVALILVVAFQSKKIRELERPKFGFLGKPLSLIAFVIIAGGGIGLYYLNTQGPTEVTSINANTKIELNISYEAVAGKKNVYLFKAVPVVEDINWGGTEENNFDINWIIENSKVTTEFEYDRNKSNPSAIEIELENGTNKVKAVIYVESKAFQKEVTINL